MLLFILLAQTAAPWRVEPRAGSVTVELRPVAGSPFEEMRLTTTSDQSLAALCDAIWGQGRSGNKPEGDFKLRVVLRESTDERWTYEQIRVPVASDRDYVMYARRVSPASTGRCEILFETRTDAAHPPVAGHVRIPSIRGSWTLVSGPDGKVTVSYVVYSDPGGNLPAIFVRGGQRRAALGFLKVILARAGVPPS